jgi:hypothetical protein
VTSTGDKRLDPADRKYLVGHGRHLGLGKVEVHTGTGLAKCQSGQMRPLIYRFEVALLIGRRLRGNDGCPDTVHPEAETRRGARLPEDLTNLRQGAHPWPGPPRSCGTTSPPSPAAWSARRLSSGQRAS